MNIDLGTTFYWCQQLGKLKPTVSYPDELYASFLLDELVFELDNALEEDYENISNDARTALLQ